MDFKLYENQNKSKTLFCDISGLFRVYANKGSLKGEKEPNTYTASDIADPSNEYTPAYRRAKGEIVTCTGKTKEIYLEGNWLNYEDDEVLDEFMKRGYITFGYKYISSFQPGGTDCVVTASGNIYESARKVTQEEIEFGKIFREFAYSLKSNTTKKLLNSSKFKDEKYENLMKENKIVLQNVINNHFLNMAKQKYNDLKKQGLSKEEIAAKHNAIKEELIDTTNGLNQYYTDIDIRKKELEEIQKDFNV